MKERQHLERTELAIFWLCINLMVLCVHHGFFLRCNKALLRGSFQEQVIDHNCSKLKLEMRVEWYKTRSGLRGP